jgi:beta-galactosidase/beta-glucuronidase
MRRVCGVGRWRGFRGGRAVAVSVVCLLLMTVVSGSAGNPSGLVKPVAASALSLDGEWAFAVDTEDAGIEGGWAERRFDDSSWQPVEVPHTWGVMPEHSEHEGIAWYRRRFLVPSAARDAEVRLRFDAVFYEADIWLNGEHIGSHEGGYTAFGFDVSGVVEPGSENVLAVRVSNRRATTQIPATLRSSWSYDWWNWGGIVRAVTVELRSRAYIERQRTVAIPHLRRPHEADRATLEVSVTVRNASDQAVEGVLRCAVFDDADGSPALEPPVAEPISLEPGGVAEIDLVVDLDSPKLWHFDHPHLYRWQSSLVDSEGQLLHTEETTFGIRSIELSDAQFRLNGEPMRLVGLTRHADSPEHGLAETVTVMAQDYDDLKRLNMVFSRPVHYPQHEFILDYCDRNGILLIPEVPAWQLTERQMSDPDMRALEMQQLHEMVDEAFNHPSVWAWSIGNEFESKSLAGHAFAREMMEYIKSLDPTRPVAFASNHLEERPSLDATTYSDFVMMNQYFGTWHGQKSRLGEALDAVHEAWPDKPVVISEFGFEPRWNDLIGRPSHAMDAADYYVFADELPSESEQADALRQQVIREQLEVFRSRPYVAGAIFWTYQDYRTPSGFVMGVVDAERVRRGAYEVLREEYSPVLVQSVAAAAGSEGGSELVVALRTRGLDDIPSYTLSGYSLLWSISASDGDILERGEISLPVLEPGCEWEGTLRSRELRGEVMLVLRIMRPTGHEVLLQEYDSRGRPIGRTAG